jgi:hypothetical protein
MCLTHPTFSYRLSLYRSTRTALQITDLTLITCQYFVATISRNSQNYIEHAYTELRQTQEHVTLTTAGAPNDGGNTNVRVRKFHLGTDHETQKGNRGINLLFL